MESTKSPDITFIPTILVLRLRGLSNLRFPPLPISSTLVVPTGMASNVTPPPSAVACLFWVCVSMVLLLLRHPGTPCSLDVTNSCRQRLRYLTRNRTAVRLRLYKEFLHAQDQRRPSRLSPSRGPSRGVPGPSRWSLLGQEGPGGLVDSQGCVCRAGGASCGGDSRVSGGDRIHDRGL